MSDPTAARSTTGAPAPGQTAPAGAATAPRGTTGTDTDVARLTGALDAHAEVINELIATLTGAKLITEETAAWLHERVQDGRNDVAAIRLRGRIADDTSQTGAS